MLSGRTRDGGLHMDERAMTIRAICRMQRGHLPTVDPLGYAFEVGGQPVKAIDLNGGDKTIHAPRDGPDRQLVLAASLALAILWDPAD